MFYNEFSLKVPLNNLYNHCRDYFINSLLKHVFKSYLMGIYKLRKYLLNYINSGNYHYNIKSQICYLDYTSYIYQSAFYILHKYSNIGIERTIDMIYERNFAAFEHFYDNNKAYFKQFILCVDYRFIADNNVNFNINEHLINEYFDNISKKHLIRSNPMIPYQFVNKSFNDIVPLIRCCYELKWNYWNNVKNITNYISIKRAIELCDNQQQKQVLNKCYLIGRNRYILLNGAIKKRDKMNYINKLTNATNNDEFKQIMIEYLNNVPNSCILKSFNKFVKMVNEKYNNVEILGCENEVDFVIRKHIKQFNHVNPTIITKDSDMLMLLSNIDCVIKINIKIPHKRAETYSFNPKHFWLWLFDSSYNLIDVVRFCLLLGCGYTTNLQHYSIENIRLMKLNNQFANNSLEFRLGIYIYSQLDYLENTFHYISDDCDNADSIIAYYTNIYTMNLLNRCEHV